MSQETNQEKTRLLKVIESKDTETIEMLTKVSIILNKEELKIAIKALSNPITKNLALSYLK